MIAGKSDAECTRECMKIERQLDLRSGRWKQDLPAQQRYEEVRRLCRPTRESDGRGDRHQHRGTDDRSRKPVRGLDA